MQKNQNTHNIGMNALEITKTEHVSLDTSL